MDIRRQDEEIPASRDLINSFLRESPDEADPLRARLFMAMQIRRSQKKMSSKAKRDYFEAMMAASEQESLRPIVMADLELELSSGSYHDKSDTLTYMSHTGGLAKLGMALTLQDNDSERSLQPRLENIIKAFREENGYMLKEHYKTLVGAVERMHKTVGAQLKDYQGALPLQLLVRIAEDAAEKQETESDLQYYYVSIINDFSRLYYYLRPLFVSTNVQISAKLSAALYPIAHEARKPKRSPQSDITESREMVFATLMTLEFPTSAASLLQEPQEQIQTPEAPGEQLLLNDKWENLLDDYTEPSSTYRAAIYEGAKFLSNEHFSEVQTLLNDEKAAVNWQSVPALPDEMLNVITLHGFAFARTMGDEENPDLRRLNNLLTDFTDFLQETLGEEINASEKFLLFLIATFLFNHYPGPGKRAKFTKLLELKSYLKPDQVDSYPRTKVEHLGNNFFKAGKALSKEAPRL